MMGLLLPVLVAVGTLGLMLLVHLMPPGGLIYALLVWGIPLAAGGAILFGHLACAHIRNARGVIGGLRYARAGLALGYVCGVAYFTLPNLVSPREGLVSACVANQKQIEGAKATWALEHRQPATTTPTDQDLFGPGKYVREKPRCPGGGTYTLNPLNVKVTCSIPGHTY